MRPLLVSLLLLLCAPVAHADDGCATDRLVTLFFGRDRPGHPRGVTERAWQAFLLAELAPRVGGWTELAGAGGWRGPGGRLLREPTRVVQVAHATGDGFDPRAVAAAYARRFDQASVLVVDQPACGVFVGP